MYMARGSRDLVIFQNLDFSDELYTGKKIKSTTDRYLVFKVCVWLLQSLLMVVGLTKLLLAVANIFI